jgi:hypothetical protein
MKFLRWTVAAVAACAFGNAYAFHDGGVANCEGCHVMHNASHGNATHFTGQSYIQAQTVGTSGQASRSDRTNPFLLQGADQSSTCLVCHSGQNTGSVATQHKMADLSASASGSVPANYTPGGDFGWLIKNFTWNWTGNIPGTSAGAKHGHNIVALDYGLATVDQNQAPGGTFMTGTGNASLACTNCHDPHGRYRLQGSAATPVIRGPSAVGAAINPIIGSGSYGVPAAVPGGGAPDLLTQAIGVYRLLGGKGYRPVSNPGFPFQNDPPVAVAPATYNQVETPTAEVRVAYGSGMSEWCANCHTYIHLDNYATGADGLVHPAGNGGKFRQTQADIYNSYKSSGDLTGTNTYTSLVPFESQVTDLGQLASAATNAGNTTVAAAGVFVAQANVSNVMCLSCHRAHATGWDNAARWNIASTFITTAAASGALLGNADYDQGRTAAETRAANYGRDNGNGFAPFQRSVCNKCHAKD